jgi:hypothetical protein
MSGHATVAVQTIPQRFTEESLMSARPQSELQQSGPSRARASRIVTALAVALAAGLSVAAAQAADAPATDDAPKTSRPNTTTGSRIPDRSLSDLDEVMVIGAVNDPADAQAPEDTSVPALPERKAAPRRAEATTGSRIADRPMSDLDEVIVFGGAVEDPRDAALPEDTSLPELPVVDATLMPHTDF